MAHRVPYLVKTYNVLASLVINTDQTWIHFVPTSGERIWEMKGSKDIHVFGVEDNMQFKDLPTICGKDFNSLS